MAAAAVAPPDLAAAHGERPELAAHALALGIVENRSARGPPLRGLGPDRPAAGTR
jgi:hypothetical protein